MEDVEIIKKKPLYRLKGDASPRKFYRGKNIIVFSKIDKKKNLLIYDAINKLLIKNKIAAPKLIKQNYNQNYIEIEDLGDTSILDLLIRKKNKFKIFFEIIDLLYILQKIKQKKIKTFLNTQYKVPEYKKKDLINEAKLFVDWYIPYKKKKYNNKTTKKNFNNILKQLVEKLKFSNKTFVHRDFHISNIMFKNQKFFLIDNQDAVYGNITYDLASLIDDVRFKTSHSFKKKVLVYFLKKWSKKNNKQKLLHDFRILSVLRNLKIIGIFIRLAQRDKKTKYLKLIPYCWKLIENRVGHDNLFRDLRFFLKKIKIQNM